MVLAGHSDSAYNNVRKPRIHDDAHIMLSEETPVPIINGPVLTVSQIIKFVMSSAVEIEIIICAKAMVQLCQTLIKMGWPQPKYSIQCDNSTSVGVANDNIIQRKTKTMNMQYHWLRCSEAQFQFWLFWGYSANNLADLEQKPPSPLL